MATMSYCAFENTTHDMSVSLEKLQGLAEEGVESLEHLDAYERGGLKRLIEQCREFVSVYNDMTGESEDDQY